MEFNDPYRMPWLTQGPYNCYGWEQLQDHLARDEDRTPASRDWVPMPQTPEAEDLSTVIVEPENPGLIESKDKMGTAGPAPEPKPFECVLFKEEKFEDSSDDDEPTETQMFECVYVKQEPLAENTGHPETDEEQECANTTQTEGSHATNPAGQSVKFPEAVMKTEEAPHAVAGETVTERSLPSAADVFRETPDISACGPQDYSRPAGRLSHTPTTEGSNCFSSHSPRNDCHADETATSPSPVTSPETQGLEISCRVCGEVFGSAYSLAEHICGASGGQPPYLLCESCGEMAYSAEQLADHALRLHNRHVAINEESETESCEEDRFAADFCATVYNREESEEDCSPIDMCKSVRRKRSKDRFPRARRAKILLKCNLCGKVYGRKHELNNHMCVKGNEYGKESAISTVPPTSESENSVTSLGETSSLLPTVSAHIPPPGTDRPYACDVCGKSFPKPCQLNYHMRTHTGERPFDCSICGKKFAKRAHVNVHMRTHTGARLHSCDICGKSFVESCKRNRHMLSHKGEKSFICNICGKAYMFSSSLSSHKRSHTGDNLNECGVCGKSFPRPSVLKVHLRSHTGEKPHQCGVCGKSFTQVGNLKRHVQAHLSGTLQT